MKEVVYWLRTRLRESERAQKLAVKRWDYAEAHLIQGHIEAYAYAIENVEAMQRAARKGMR